MTFNINNQNCKSCDIDSKFAKCKPKHPKPKKVLLACGQGNGNRTFISSNDSPFLLANASLDTTCLNKPKVLIKFSSLVRIELLDGIPIVRLQYELFRSCDSGEPVSLGTWMFERTNFINSFFGDTEESFSFIFCECQTFGNCCEYFVTVTPVEITDATATVNNGRIAALSIPACDCLNKYKNIDRNNKDSKFYLNHPNLKEILVECGQGNGEIVFRQTTDPSTNIAHITIDTTCLSRSEVLIEFSSIISFSTNLTNGVLQFELFRVCDNMVPVSLGIWNFERSDFDIVIANSNYSKAFSFIFCEALVCPCCYEYFVTVTALDISGGTDSFARINNGRMLAIAYPTTDCRDNNAYNSLDEKCYSIDCFQNHPKPKKILLECGDESGSRNLTSSNDAAFQLTYVTIDTTNLCNPLVNIEFSSIVRVQGSDTGQGSVRLLYELFRACDDKAPISVGVWPIERINFPGGSTVQLTNTVDFTFCECTTCAGYCNYFVTVTPVQIDDGIIVTISNGRIAAIARE